MIPQVFLSLSGKDDAFVEAVWRRLPIGLAMFYRKAFHSGEYLLTKMEKCVGNSSIFVFFASHDSLRSRWVQFEIEQARLEKIQRPDLRLLVFPLTADISSGMLPPWMQRYWSPRAGYNPKDIARYITQLLKTPPFAPPALAVRPIGRGQLLDTATQAFQEVVARTNFAPNILIFTGLNGIGRKTFARYFVEQGLASRSTLQFGPELALPLYADLADFYRDLRQNIETDFTLQTAENDLQIFRSADMPTQVSEIVNSIGYFSKLGQAVFVTTGAGLFEERGDLKSWVKPLFHGLSSTQEAVLCLISIRKIPDEELRDCPNVLQIHVPELKDADVRALITASSSALGIKPLAPNDALLRTVGGHPDVAKAVVRLVHQRGEGILVQNPVILFGIQDEILSDNLDVSALNDIQKELLCMLSWVPRLQGRILQSVLANRHAVSELDFFYATDNLVLGCLVEAAGTTLAISPAIRPMFRRRYGFGPEGLLHDFSNALAAEWNSSLGNDDFRGELFDAFVFMHALEGKSLPPPLRELLLPSTLREVLRETYDRGRDDEDALRRVVAWGRIADGMRMDETVREEVFATVVRAHIRLGEYGEAESILKEFDRSGYRSAPFLRGFSLRRQGKWREAVTPLREALAARKSDRFALQELATCYQRLGMQRELSDLTVRYAELINENAVLLDFRIGVLIAQGDFAGAEAAIQRLQGLPQDDGRAMIRRAQIMIQRHHDYRKAKTTLSDLVQKGVGRPVTVRRWRAIAAAFDQDYDLARQDIQYIRSRPAGDGEPPGGVFRHRAGAVRSGRCMGRAD